MHTHGLRFALLIGAVLVLPCIARASTLDPVLTVIGSPPPELMPGLDSVSAASPEVLMSAKTLTGVPAAMWYYGCTATSAGMLFGYYDSIGYSNMLAGEIAGRIDTPLELSLIATQDHITDYWKAYDSVGPDPWVSGGVEHAWSRCTADFLGTNQWKWDYNGGGIDFNRDGSTVYWSLDNGQPLYDYIPPASFGLPQTEAGHGLRLFAESRGYSVAYRNGNYQVYNQRIDTLYPGAGFSFAQYMAEIDAGRPVLIHVTNHTMLGYGYNEETSQVILYDTWNYDSHTMTWGGTYAGLQHRAVTVLELNPAPEIEANVPEPGTTALFGGGLAALAMVLRRRRQTLG